MSERKWTPGPWKWADDRDKTGLIYLTGVLIAEHTDGTPWGDDMDRANAHLIAAAPELYEALEEIRDMLWSRPDISDRLRPLMGFAEEATNQKARAALAKARGEQ